MAKSKLVLEWALRKGGGASWWVAKIRASEGVELVLSVSAGPYWAHALSTDDDPIEWRVKIQTSYEVSRCNSPPTQIAGGRAANVESGQELAKAWVRSLSTALTRSLAEIPL